MRFKGSLTTSGRHVLEKRFLPTLAKFGKQVTMVIGQQEIHFLHQTNNLGTVVLLLLLLLLIIILLFLLLLD